MKTYYPSPSDIKREWHLIDASGQTLGRMASQVAQLLQGKHKAMFTRNLDTGDGVIVINAAKVHVTGNKLKQKLYYRHSMYPGGFRVDDLEKMMKEFPTRVIEHAVRGMLPRNRLGDKMMGKLRVYAGEDHPHIAQLKSEPVAEEKGS